MLISLTIIGVLAAITVPALVQRTNKQEYVTALQKAYSTLSQVTQEIIAENGSPKGEEGWADSNEHVYELYKAHMNNVKECSAASGCIPQTYFHHLNGEYRTHYDASNTRMLKFVSGSMQFMIEGGGWTTSACNKRANGTTSSCSFILVDVNGPKAPNIMGRDMFYFTLKENGLYPCGCDYDDCTMKSLGSGCACKVLREGAINY